MCFKTVLQFFPQLGKPVKPRDDKKKAVDPEGYWELAKSGLLGNPKKFL